MHRFLQEGSISIRKTAAMYDCNLSAVISRYYAAFMACSTTTTDSLDSHEDICQNITPPEQSCVSPYAPPPL